jgi:predicted RecB family nuclease
MRVCSLDTAGTKHVYRNIIRDCFLVGYGDADETKDSEVVRELLQYNREDCLAMKYVEEWLRNLATS